MDSERDRESHEREREKETKKEEEKEKEKEREREVTLASNGAIRSPAQPWLGLSRSHPEPSSALAWPLTEPPGAQLSLGKSTWTASETERVR